MRGLALKLLALALLCSISGGPMRAADDLPLVPVDENSRRNPTMLAAFGDAVQLAGKSTVRVMAGDRQLALGAIVDASGLVLSKASELKQDVVCELSDGSRYPAQVLVRDQATDLALLKIPADHLPAVRWSSQASVSVGTWVATPGFRQRPDAIGVISVKQHPVRGGVLGIKIGDDPQGARVGFVVPQSGAAKAGVRLDDIVTHIGDQAVSNSDELISAVRTYLPGQQVVLTVLRHGRTFKLNAVLGSDRGGSENERAAFQNQLGGPLSARRSGFLSVLEHDSVLLPSQCGGALVDLNGEVVGINIARASRVSSYAIPASTARPLVEHLKQTILTPVATDSSQKDQQR